MKFLMSLIYKQFTYLETFKILKFRYPSYLTTKLKLKNCKIPSKMFLEPYNKSSTTKRLFINKSISLWNSITPKLFSLPPLNSKLNIIIPGSCKNSDLTSPLVVIKKRLKSYLKDCQSTGNPKIWEKMNCQNF